MYDVRNLIMLYMVININPIFGKTSFIITANFQFTCSLFLNFLGLGVFLFSHTGDTLKMDYLSFKCKSADIFNLLGLWLSETLRVSIYVYMGKEKVRHSYLN